MLHDNNSRFPGGSDGKESACDAGDLGSVPGSGRSSGGGHDNPLQYFCLENPMSYIIHGVARCRTQLSYFHYWDLVPVFLCTFSYLFFFFNCWSIIALQYCACFCCTTKWISYMYITSLLNLTSIPLCHHRALRWIPCTIQQLPTSYLLIFYTW